MPKDESEMGTTFTAEEMELLRALVEATYRLPIGVPYSSKVMELGQPAIDSMWAKLEGESRSGELRSRTAPSSDLPLELLTVLRDPENRLKAEGPALDLIITRLRKKPIGDITLRRSALLAMLLGAIEMGKDKEAS